MKVTVRMPDGEQYLLSRLLSPANHKQQMGRGYRSAGLVLTPLAVGRSGRNLCEKATKGCAKCCYAFSSRMAWPQNRKVAVARTRLLTADPNAFLRMLTEDVAREERAASGRGTRLVCRLNMVSDVPFEREFPSLFRDFPKVQFMDYTKDPERLLDRGLPRNYHLTLSRSESNAADCRRALDAGKNVAVVFRRLPYPAAFWGYGVIDGEAHDYRFLDPSPRVVGLFAKGKAAREDATGFVVDADRPSLTVLPN